MKIQFKALLLLYIILVVSTQNTFAHPERAYFLSGKIGEIQVGMRIDEFDNICTLNYITNSSKKEFTLRGSIEIDSSYIFHPLTWIETNSDQNESEKLILKQLSNHAWEGKWIFGDSIIQKVVLKPINIDSLNHPYLEVIKKYNLNAYFAYRTKDIVFKKTRTQKIAAGIKVVWYNETETGIEMFRVLKNKQLSDVKSINDFLTYEHLSQVGISQSKSNADKPQIYEINCTVNFLNSNYLSFTLRTKSSHNEHNKKENVIHYNLYTKTAQRFMLEEIVWFGEQPKPKIREGGENWFAYRYKVFGAKVLEIFTAIFPEKMIETEDATCKYSDVKIWQFPTWYITREGVYLGSVSQTFDPLCNTASWSIIPWDYLQEYLIVNSEQF